MQGLIANRNISPNTIIDTYFGMIVAFTEDSITDLKDIPNTDRAANLAPAGILMEDDTGRALKVGISILLCGRGTQY
jgi:hypothetical protein